MPLSKRPRPWYWGKCQKIEARLKNGPWVMGIQDTACDLYVLVYYGWAVRFGLPVAGLTHDTSLKQRLLDRPAVRRGTELEKHPLLTIA